MTQRIHKGRPLGIHGSRFASINSKATGLYVCELSDGTVKVGCSTGLRNRLTMLSRQMAEHGLDITRFEVDASTGQTFNDVHGREKKLLKKVCAYAAPVAGRREYFDGISFESAVSLMRGEPAQA